MTKLCKRGKRYSIRGICCTFLWKMGLLLIFLASILVWQINSISGPRKYCPPSKFFEHRRNRLFNSSRSAIITEVHGQKEQTGLDWGIFVSGELVSRFLYHHIAIIGFDHVIINCIYNATIHSTVPSLEEIYPPKESCVSAWSDLGLITWRTIKYAGPESDWPIHPDTNKPDLEKDLYKNLRGINPVYAEIKSKKLFDWVLIIDMDELLLSIHWKPKTLNWCHQSTNPTILDVTLNQMMVAATRRYLYDYMVMNASRTDQRKASDACKYGESTNYDRKCHVISSFMMPSYWWTNLVIHSERTDVLPKLRFPFPSAYENDLRQHANATEEWDGGYQTWKSIHRVAHSPYLSGIVSMHQGGGFKVLAPRKFHGRLSFEVAHVKRNCPDNCEKVLVRDNKIAHLYDDYDKCINEMSQ